MRHYNHWRILTKVFIVTNAIVSAFLMAFAPESLTYVVAHVHQAGIIPTIAFFAGIAVLLVDLFKTDHMIAGKRRWFGYKFMPVCYMIIGAGYLIFAFMCSFVDGASVLMINALIQTALTGWVAVLTQRDLYDL